MAVADGACIVEVAEGDRGWGGGGMYAGCARMQVGACFRARAYMLQCYNV